MSTIQSSSPDPSRMSDGPGGPVSPDPTRVSGGSTSTSSPTTRRLSAEPNSLVGTAIATTAVEQKQVDQQSGLRSLFGAANVIKSGLGSLISSAGTSISRIAKKVAEFSESKFTQATSTTSFNKLKEGALNHLQEKYKESASKNDQIQMANFIVLKGLVASSTSTSDIESALKGEKYTLPSDVREQATVSVSDRLDTAKANAKSNISDLKETFQGLKAEGQRVLNKVLHAEENKKAEAMRDEVLGAINDRYAANPSAELKIAKQVIENAKKEDGSVDTAVIKQELKLLNENFKNDEKIGQRFLIDELVTDWDATPTARQDAGLAKLNPEQSSDRSSIGSSASNRSSVDSSSKRDSVSSKDEEFKNETLKAKLLGDVPGPQKAQAQRRLNAVSTTDDTGKRLSSKVYQHNLENALTNGIQELDDLDEIKNDFLNTVFPNTDDSIDLQIEISDAATKQDGKFISPDDMRANLEKLVMEKGSDNDKNNLKDSIKQEYIARIVVSNLSDQAKEDAVTSMGAVDSNNLQEFRDRLNNMESLLNQSF